MVCNYEVFSNYKANELVAIYPIYSSNRLWVYNWTADIHVDRTAVSPRIRRSFEEGIMSKFRVVIDGDEKHALEDVIGWSLPSNTLQLDFADGSTTIIAVVTFSEVII